MNNETKARKLLIFSAKQFNNLSVFERLRYICLLGHLAPSTHNTQPWRFKINSSNSEIIVYIDRQMILPESDKVGRQSIISLGCCLQNMIEVLDFFHMEYKLALKAVNKKSVTPNLNQRQRELIEIASIVINPSAKPKNINENNFFKEIFQRKVMRAEFDASQDVPERVLKLITSFCAEKKIDYKFIQKGFLKQAISEFQGQADNFVINSRTFSRELGQWLLPNDTKSDVGMPGIGFGLKADQAKRLHLALVGERVLEPEDGLKFSTMGKIFLEKSPLIITLFSRKDEIEDWLRTGMVLEKNLLLFQQNQLSASIHAAIVEVGLVNKIFSATLGTTQRLITLLRVGKVKNQADLDRPFSPRLPIESVLVD